MKIERSNAVRLVRFLVGLFFRRVEVSGVERVPTTGGGILIAWHPNGLVDPALIISGFPRRVVFGARHGLFAWPIVGRLMRALGTVPIFRAADAKDGNVEARREANRKSLDAMAQAVCDAVLGPRPRSASSMYDAQDSPQPPSKFCRAVSHLAARCIDSDFMSTPTAISAGTTAAAPYR